MRRCLKLAPYLHYLSNRFNNHKEIEMEHYQDELLETQEFDFDDECDDAYEL